MRIHSTQHRTRSSQATTGSRRDRPASMSDSEGEPSAGGNRGEGPPRRRRRLNVLPGSPGSESDEGRDSGAREAVDEEREAREAEEARRDLLAAQGIDGGIDSGDERPISVRRAAPPCPPTATCTSNPRSAVLHHCLAGA
jgi:hypothetical protein